MENVDIIIIGAGVVGLAIGAQLSKKFNKVLVLDKNLNFGEETSSRNSEVIHGGLYYPQNSLKAQLCTQGKFELYKFCQLNKVPYNQIGKLIVAQDKDEEIQLGNINNQALHNGVSDLTFLNHKEILTKEPHLSGTSALLSPSTGILDVHSYMLSLVAQLERNQGTFVGNTQVLTAEPNNAGFIVNLTSHTEFMTLKCRYLINSAGLHSEQVAHSIEGLNKTLIPQMHWCKGHYFSYSGKSPFSQLIYPVPEANTKGLGIHATLDLGGQLKFGPDTQYIEKLNYDFKSDLKPKFIKAIKRYFPAINPEKLQPSYTGIRPKLQGPNEAFKDFNIQTSNTHKIPGLVNLFGIESPGLTASLAIGKYVEDILFNES